MEYPKINSLWKRQGWYLEEGKKNNPEYQAGRQSFIVGDYAREEFGLINKWRVEEKIDGTNIRVDISRLSYTIFQGRTDKAEIPAVLHRRLSEIFNDFTKKEFWNKDKKKSDHLILFGEGYGPNIQSGENYRDDVGFTLFDCASGYGNRWSSREEVKSIADFFRIPTPHDYGMMTEQEIIDLVKSKPQSPSAIRPKELEGVICRSEPLLICNKDYSPLMWKLKCKEFKK